MDDEDIDNLLDEVEVKFCQSQTPKSASMWNPASDIRATSHRDQPSGGTGSIVTARDMAKPQSRTIPDNKNSRQSPITKRWVIW